MSSIMEMEQYLLEGSRYFTIIQKSSIVLDEEEEVNLVKRVEVRYLQPEKALHRKEYTGEILAVSSKY